MFKCVGPAHIGVQPPWAEVHDLAARHGFQGIELTTSASSTRRPRSAGRSPLTWTQAAVAGAGSRCRRGSTATRPSTPGASPSCPAVRRRLPGASGVIDARGCRTVLDEIGFDGPALVEPRNAQARALAPEERVAAVAASLETVWP